MLPFVNELIENACVGMLRSEAEAEQLDAHASDFVRQVRNIVEPPAAEDVEVAEFSSEDAKLVLIFAGKNSDEEFVLGEFGAEGLDELKIALAHGIASKFDLRIGGAPHTGHECEREPVVPAVWQDGLFDELSGCSLCWKLKIRWQGDHQISRIHAL